MSRVKDVVKRIENEVGLPRAVSARIANKLNKLAKSVDWATPVRDGGPQPRSARRAVAVPKRRARPAAARKARPKAAKRSR